MADESSGGFLKEDVKESPLSSGDVVRGDSQKSDTAAAESSKQFTNSEIVNGVATDGQANITDLDVKTQKTESGDAYSTSSVSPIRVASSGNKQTENDNDEEEDDDDDDEDDDWMSEEGDESDIEDNVDLAFPLHRRQSNPVLPDTVTPLVTEEGCKVYLIGTAHFSVESQDDVSNVIRAVQPDTVMVELCKSRINILELNEEMLLEEAKNINLAKFRLAVKQSGVVQGIMHLLLLSMSAHLTKQLGMAPGGEFRRAFQEARLVPGCRMQLGDRPIQITLKRALGALSVWQKLKLAWYLIFTKDPISKEDVEKCKQRDLLEQLLNEMTGEFPALSRVFVEERDIFLTHSLKMAATMLNLPDRPPVPSVTVGVVGIGHVPGIIANWSKEQDIKDIITIPPGSVLGKVVKWSIRASLLCVLSYGCLRLYRWTSHAFL